MIALYTCLKIVHVLGSTILFGTGIGIAFFMLMAHRTGDARFIARTAGIVVFADAVFTASAVVLQPATGVALAYLAGYDFASPWIAGSIGLYVLAGLFWLPVVWIQIRLRDLAAQAADRAEPLPPAYHRLFRVWFAFGFPAFGAVIAIFVLMIAKPAAI